MLSKLIVQAPGRINLIGEHTDYNGGFALPAAIDKQIIVTLQKNNHPSVCTIEAENVHDSVQINLKDLPYNTDKVWLKYIIGVVEELRKRGASIDGFDAKFTGNVPLGAGMSSSAALECSFALGLNQLFDLNFDKMTLVKIAQKAEHNYVGSMCGIMDQYASMMGKKDHVLLLDCQKESHQFYPIDLENYEILIINSNVKHSLADSEYNTRRRECESGVAIIQKVYPKVQFLRDVSTDQLEDFKNQMTSTIFNRCQYVVEENDRVLRAVAMLEKGNLTELGQLMYQSHAGLQNKFEVSCAELDYLVNQTRNQPYIIGARMMGGGFGGCTINLIENGTSNQFIDKVSSSYEHKFGKKITYFKVAISDGAKII